MFSQEELNWFKVIETGMSSPEGQVDKKMKKKKKWLPYYETLTDWAICKNILNDLKTSVDFTDKKFLVVDTVEFALILLRFGVKPSNITYIADYKYINGLAKHCGINVVDAPSSSLEKFKNMKVDVVVGNPPFNIAGDKGELSNNTTGSNSGTGGNSVLYRTFRKKALGCLKPGGILAFISPKNIVKDLVKDNNQVDVINLMSDTDCNYWKYNTLYFIERNTPKTKPWSLHGGICAKIFGIEEWQYNEFGRTEYREGTGNTLAVLQVPKKASGFQPVTALVETALPAAPRFGFSLLESKKSYMTTDLPFCASMAGCVTLDSMDHANRLKLFIENNKAIVFFFKNMKLKSFAKDILRFSKAFDLNQIITGKEYPKEWNLTPEEIKYIESEVE